jgi:molybdopterin-binding protein
MSTITAINTRNQFRGKVVGIKRSPVVSEVEIETAAGIVSAIVTSSSLELLDLKIGDSAIALFKATEVLIAAVAND